MWRPSRAEDASLMSLVELQSVASDTDWRRLEIARREIEIAFAGGAPNDVPSMIAGIKKVISNFEADWFFAVHAGEIVGEAGLVEFTIKGKKVGRLQDIDILPKFQGRRLGNELLKSIFLEARKRGLTGLCLKADEDRWVKDWYVRRGFEHVGTWYPEKLQVP